MIHDCTAQFSSFVFFILRYILAASKGGPVSMHFNLVHCSDISTKISLIHLAILPPIDSVLNHIDFSTSATFVVPNGIAQTFSVKTNGKEEGSLDTPGHLIDYSTYSPQPVTPQG